MNQPKQEIVPFQGTEIVTFTEENQHNIAIKPICELFGIAWNAQFERLKRDELFSSTIRIIRTVGADDKQREMVCLPLEYFPMWLAKIETRRVKNPMAKELILAYQKEAAKVLYFHFFGNPIQLQNEITDLKDRLLEVQSITIEAYQRILRRNYRKVVTPEMRKKIVKMRDEKGMPYSKIGFKLGISGTAAKMHYDIAKAEAEESNNQIKKEL